MKELLTKVREAPHHLSSPFDTEIRCLVTQSKIRRIAKPLLAEGKRVAAALHKLYTRREQEIQNAKEKAWKKYGRSCKPLAKREGELKVRLGEIQDICENHGKITWVGLQDEYTWYGRCPDCGFYRR